MSKGWRSTPVVDNKGFVGNGLSIVSKYLCGVGLLLCVW